MASKLLGSFSIREKGVGGLRQFDGGHKLKSRLVDQKPCVSTHIRFSLTFQDFHVLVTVTQSIDFNPMLVEKRRSNIFSPFFSNTIKLRETPESLQVPSTDRKVCRVAYVNRIGYGKNLGGLGNPQPSPKVYISICIPWMQFRD